MNYGGGGRGLVTKSSQIYFEIKYVNKYCIKLVDRAKNEGRPKLRYKLTCKTYIKCSEGVRLTKAFNKLANGPLIHV